MVIYSTGEVARRLALQRYQLDYLLETGQVAEPQHRLAGKRLWTEAEVRAAERALRGKDVTGPHQHGTAEPKGAAP